MTLLHIAKLFVLFMVYDNVGGSFTDKNRLFRYLLSSYNKHLIPEVGPHNNVNVTHDLTLNRIVSFENQVLVLDAMLSMRWTDNQLMWDPTEHGDILQFNLPSDMIWKPDILLLDNADLGSRHEDINVVITYDGTVFYTPQAKLSVYCQMPDHIERGDVVSCNLKFTSWTYDGDTLNLITFDDEVGFASESGKYFNKHWQVTSSFVKRNVNKYDCCPESYIDLTYSLSLKFLG